VRPSAGTLAPVGEQHERAGVVTQLWRYPVKSMLGEQLPFVELDERGLRGDRGWAVRDEVRGGIRGAKKLKGLMAFGARYLSEPGPDGADGPRGSAAIAPAEVTLPDGRTVRTDDPGAGALVSEALGHEVTLWPLQPASDLDHYRRGRPDSTDGLAELRAVFALEPEDPLPDFSVFPPEIMEFESPPGTYLDAYPLLIMTDRSLASLQELAPASVIDVRRFRPNILVAADGDGPFPEQAWVGGRLRLGGAEVSIPAGCPRCVMTTHGFADLPADRSIMRTLVRETDQVLGVYGTVVGAGTVRVGDEVELTLV